MQEMEDLESLVSNWENKIDNLISEVDNLLLKEFQSALIKKYCGIGIAITVSTWILFYIFHIVRDFLQ
ncbi:hypothetical protein DBT_1738 [Dissulfuribacter thermophilus]|uniref:Uncharacterized protein n=1 Tax=Dissulfuribacter thermophilus TaxID=1156395 RepID=A0A1B9F509_9BACT|nr:hypothetical protein [Dissulfuribacter thermophilus]OCC14943.1 hypothetical protein DBT_1738 [Dissulfuribacter thermophilus]